MNSVKYKQIWGEIREELDRIFLPLTEKGHQINISKSFSEVHLALILADKPEMQNWVWLNRRSVMRDPLFKLVKVTPAISTDEELKAFARSLEFIAEQTNTETGS